MKNKQMKATTIYLANLNYELNEDNIFDLVKKCAYVESIKILRQGSGNRSKGVAFVTLASLQGAEKAIKYLHGLNHQGRTLKAKIADRQLVELKPKKVDRPKSMAYEVKKQKKRRKDGRPSFLK